MQMHEARQVREVDSPQEVNRLLGEGWTLLAVLAVTSPHNLAVTISRYVRGRSVPA